MISHWRKVLVFLAVVGAVALFSSFHIFTRSSASGTWVTRASMPLPRGFEGAAVVNGKVYVIGGTNNYSGVFPSVQIYDPTTDSWSMGAPMPTPRMRMAVVAVGGKIYTIGGGPGYTDVINTVEVYDPATDTWQTRANAPLSAIGFAAAAAPDGKIYVFGGYFGCCGNYSNTTYVYDPLANSWSTRASMPTAREGGHAALAPNGKIYVMGGNSNTASSTAIEEYNPAANTWAIRSPLPYGVSYAPGIAGDDGMLYVFGGATGYTQQYDPATDAWSLLPAMPTSRGLLAAAAPGNGYIYTFGGILEGSPFPFTWVSTNEALAVGPGPTPTPTTPVPTPIASTCAAWNYTANNLQVSRYALRATTLADGRILIEGGQGNISESEIYEPASNMWSVTGSLNQGRGEHTATLLPSGKVLVTGGYGGPFTSAELYDPATGSWTFTGSMGQPRTRHSATLLPNGKVLVEGGWNGNMTASAELYDPSTGTWSPTGSMFMTRADHIAVLLPNGKVLVAGGAYTNGAQTNDAELYNPGTGTWSVTGSLNIARENFGAALLPNGKVLVMGGSTGTFGSGFTATAETYDPATGAWTQIASMSTSRFLNPWQQPVSLPDGTVLVIGGDSPSVGSTSSGTSEAYDPITATWGSIASMHEIHGGGSTALLADGRPLIVAGNGFAGTSLRAEICGPSSPTTPTPTFGTVVSQQTSTPTPPGSVGGLSLDAQLPGSSESDAALLAGAIAGATGVIALGGAAWYTRQQSARRASR